MIKDRIFIAGLWLFLGGIFPAGLSAGTVTLSTYYPAPYGAYDRMRLVPRDTLPAKLYCHSVEDEGVLYFDNGKQEKSEGLYVCQQTDKSKFEWVFVSRPITAEEPIATGKEKIVCVKADGKLGVCMNNPSADGTCGCSRSEEEPK